jgi:hypothetical protein
VHGPGNGRGVICAVRVEAVERGAAAITSDSNLALKKELSCWRVGCSVSSELLWLRHRDSSEPSGRGTSAVGSHYQRTLVRTLSACHIEL